MRTHLAVVVDETEVPGIARLRHRWDPLMAAGVPPHITVAYPEEFTDTRPLISRANKAARALGPFLVHLRDPAVFGGHSDRGLYVSVDDPGGSRQMLRTMLLLAPPFTAMDIAPRLTVVHPRTSQQGLLAWDDVRRLQFEQVLTVS